MAAMHLNDQSDSENGVTQAQTVHTANGKPLVELPGYEILAEVGRGGMGVVYKARDLTLNRIVAVKMLHDVGTASSEQLERFQIEAQAVAQLHHPHIVQIFTSGSHQQLPYFVMEYVSGTTLAGTLNGQPQPPRDAARLVMLLARAMQAAHRSQIIHRDLIPQNILLAPPADEPALNTRYGCPKITDFGLAKNLQNNQAITLSGRVLGTLRYMAPEQLEGDAHAVGPGTDVYALGGILYEMLVGRTPFSAETLEDLARQVLLVEPVPPTSLREGIPRALEAICLRCLAKKPVDRFPSAAALADALLACLDEPRAEAAPAPARGRQALQKALRSVEPAAVLVSPSVLESILRQIGAPHGWHWWVPHRKSCTVDRQTLFRHVDQEQLAIDPDQLLPMRVMLLAAPEADELEDMEPGALYQKYWQRLFHSSIHVTLDNLWAEGKLTAAGIRERIERLGSERFEEIRTVLVEDHYLAPGPDDRNVYVEFAAVYLECRFFAPDLLPAYFPSLRDHAEVHALLRQDVNAEALFQKTRLPGASDPMRQARTSQADEAHEYFAKLVEQSEEAKKQGNVVLAAIQRRRAARMAPRAQGSATRQDALKLLLGLVERLRKPLELGDSECEQWRKHLPALLDKSDQGNWPVEAAVLYELQNVCLDHENEIFALDLVEWALSGGRRPIKRPLPGQRLVRVARTLAGAAQRLTLARLSDEDRNQFAALFQIAVERSENQVRERMRPLLTAALHDVGLNPRHPLEATAFHKVVEDVLDRILASGFITFSELRDVLSRSQLKLPDLGGPTDFIHGDPLVRLDRRLSTLLDGVYRPSEFYVRWLERATAINFGTPVGRWLTLYITAPFAGAFAILQAITIGMHAVDLAEPPALLYYPIGVLLGTVLLALMHSSVVRARCAAITHAVGRSLLRLIIHGPLWLIKHPSLKKAVASWPFQVGYWYGLKPAALSSLIWMFLADDLQTLPATAMLFLIAMFFINSGLGEAVGDAARHVLRRFVEQLRGGLLPSLVHLVTQLFKQILHMGEKLLFSVDEWLRFRSGDSRLAMTARAVLGFLWFPVAYLIRFNAVVLIEPALNPLKLPIASIATKFMLPMLIILESGLTDVCTPVLGTVLGKALTWWIVFWLPDAVAWIIWEMKENWSLYQANRRQTLRPVLLGNHGETMRGLLAPGFHSGTIPRLFARLRQAERRARKTGNYSGVRACLSALAEVEHAIHRFVTREFCALLAQTPAWGGPDLKVARIQLGINQIRVELRHADFADQSLCIEFLYRAPELEARCEIPWLESLTPQKQVLLHNALIVMCKLAGVDRIQGGQDATQPAFGQVPLTWEHCVASWQSSSALPLGESLRLFPAAPSSTSTSAEASIRGV